MYCPKCGKKILTKVNFCPYCGKEFPSTMSEAVKPKLTVKKKIAIGIISVLVCLAIVFVVIVNIKSPEELLLENSWYGELDVQCSYYKSSEYGEGYWFYASSGKRVFYSDGETKTTFYSIGSNAIPKGPYNEVISSDNIPYDVEWSETSGKYDYEWEILNENTLKFDDEYYSWDDDKDLYCYCDDRSCEHQDTWYITKDYLRIGADTFMSEKPEGLNVDE